MVFVSGSDPRIPNGPLRLNPDRWTSLRQRHVPGACRRLINARCDSNLTAASDEELVYQHRPSLHSHRPSTLSIPSEFQYSPTMKISSASLLAVLLPAASARIVVPGESDRVQLYPEGIPQTDNTQKYHIELSPGETRWVTEDEKWELRRVSDESTQHRTSTLRLLIACLARQALLRHHRPPRTRCPPR